MYIEKKIKFDSQENSLNDYSKQIYDEKQHKWFTFKKIFDFRFWLYSKLSEDKNQMNARFIVVGILAFNCTMSWANKIRKMEY